MGYAEPGIQILLIGRAFDFVQLVGMRYSHSAGSRLVNDRSSKVSRGVARLQERS
jgi:hypothetical protein